MQRPEGYPNSRNPSYPQMANTTTNSAIKNNGMIHIPTPNPGVSITPISQSVGNQDNEDQDEWGDDDDDIFLWQATQEAENRDETSKNTSLPLVNGNHSRMFPRVNSDERSAITPAEKFALRRQHLADMDKQKNETLGELFNDSGILGPTEDDMKKAQEKIEHLETEKGEFKLDILRLKGEISVLRKRADHLKKEQQVDLMQRIDANKQNQEEKNKCSAQVKALENTIEDLKGQLAKAKFASPPGSIRKKSDSSVIIHSTATFDSSASAPPSQSQSQRKISPKTTFPMPRRSNDSGKIVPPQCPKEVQTDESSFNDRYNDNNSFTCAESTDRVKNGSANPDHELHEDLWSSTSEKSREVIFRKIDEIIELRYQIIFPTLTAVLREAPVEIMRREAKRVEIASSFPDVVDYMFQWGIDKERKKSQAAVQERNPEPPPPPLILPCQLGPVAHYFDIKNGIETSFKYGGIWGALLEVKEWLQKILESLEGGGRFRVYESNTLTNFWKLMFWANELWGCVLVEENNQQGVEKATTMWVKQLEGWTALVLKCDWRSYFSLALEKEVRKFSLSILESIVTAGYFEQAQKRYDILYWIMKDVLTIDAFRTVRNVQHVLKILTWSISDLTIVRYLCNKNKDRTGSFPCLARCIGENVLKLCQEETDQLAILNLFIDYASFLEVLMMDKPINYHQSRFAKKIHEDSIQRDTTGNEGLEDSSPEDDPMDLDYQLHSQFACREKYDTRSKLPELMSEDELVSLEEEVCCWINPSKYEDPYEKLDLCQCRRILMGTSICVLSIIFEFWRKAYAEDERVSEQDLSVIEGELRRLEKSVLAGEAALAGNKTTPELSRNQQLTQLQGDRDRIKILRNKHLHAEKCSSKMTKFVKDSSLEQEWNWNDMMRLRKAEDANIESIQPWMLDYQRRLDIFNLALSKGLVIMNFLENRSDNLAAAVGTRHPYKIYMSLLPLLKLYIDELDLNAVDRDILALITSHYDEDHLSPESLSTQTKHPPFNVKIPQPELPIPLSPLNEVGLDEIVHIESDSESELKKFKANKTPDQKVSSLTDGFETYKNNAFTKLGEMTVTAKPGQAR